MNNKIFKMMMAITTVLVVVCGGIIAGKTSDNMEYSVGTDINYDNDNAIDLNAEIEEKETAILEAAAQEEAVATEISYVQREISCWGDSMMQGLGSGKAHIATDNGRVDISGYDSPMAIESMTSIPTYNFGVAGETSYEIALRAGGIGIYTDKDIYLTDSAYTRVLLTDDYGYIVDMTDYSGYGYSENDYPDTVYINGVLCDVIRDENSEYVYLSICDYPDNNIDEMYVYAGTRVIPKAAYDHQNDILVLEIGSNGGWDDYDELIYQYAGIIANNLSGEYIIVGDTDDPGLSVDSDQSEYDEYGNVIGTNDTLWESALRDAFGEHFLNTRVYLMENGLADCGLKAHRNDIIDLNNGKIPETLRYDYTHFNSYGYYSKGKAIYLKGIELGYWD